MGDRRALALARLASGLAAGAQLELPRSLMLWTLAGGVPTAPPIESDDPAGDLDRTLEASLEGRERRRGAHHTPRELADRLAALAVEPHAGRSASDTGDASMSPFKNREGRRFTVRSQQPGELAARLPTVVDPACGGGALLLAAGRLLVDAGMPVEVVARDLLWGADIAPLAAAVTEAAIALWSGGTAPASGHIVVADTLSAGAAAWPSRPPLGFDALVANPPFQGQLGRDTTRSQVEASALRERFGGVVAPYVDTAALFMLVGTELVRPGGSMAMILPQSVVASRDAAGVRTALSERAELLGLDLARGRPFAASINVCLASMTLHGDAAPATSVDWSDRLATARGVPVLELGDASGTIGDIATAVAGFRDEYYGLVGHVREAGPRPEARLITSGSIDCGSCSWGEAPTRFAKQRWARPEVDVSGLAVDNPRLAAWVGRMRKPKVLVATQTRVVEAWADHAGTAVPVTPVISVLPTSEHDITRIAGALCSPPVSVWAARRAAGTALSPGAIRVSAALVQAVPLPRDGDAWVAASLALEERDLVRYAQLATDMYCLPVESAADVITWWWSNVSRHGRDRTQPLAT